jgi:hypothetical protein
MAFRSLLAAASWLVLLLPGVTYAQQPQGPVVRGVVVDSDNDPVADAEITALDSANAVVATTHTNKAGTFVLAGVTAKVPYIYAARHVGFARGASKPITLRAIDTLNLRFTLDQITPTLPSVAVLATIDAAYRIDAAEIAKHAVVDALDVVLNLRPRMLGDAYKECRPDTSHLTFRAPRSSQLLPRLASPDDTLGQLPPNLYVNGVLHNELGMKNILSQIPVEEIAEMRYIDCHDTHVPFMMRNSLFVILKPGASY